MYNQYTTMWLAGYRSGSPHRQTLDPALIYPNWVRACGTRQRG